MHPASGIAFTAPGKLPDQRHQGMDRAVDAFADGLQVKVFRPRLASNLGRRLHWDQPKARLGPRQGRLVIQPALQQRAFLKERAHARGAEQTAKKDRVDDVDCHGLPVPGATGGAGPHRHFAGLCYT